MLAHYCPFLIRERRGLGKNVVGNADNANVVQQRSAAQPLQVGGRERELLPDADRKIGNAQAVDFLLWKAHFHHR
jgi:hypothetical protein